MEQPPLALVDADGFSCSCEAAFAPDLRGKPVAVLTKQLGIPRGAPLQQVLPASSSRAYSSSVRTWRSTGTAPPGSCRR